MSRPFVPAEDLEKVRALAGTLPANMKSKLAQEGEARADAFLAVVDGALAKNPSERRYLRALRANRLSLGPYLRNSWQLLVAGVDLTPWPWFLDLVHASYRDHLREEGLDERDVMNVNGGRAA